MSGRSTSADLPQSYLRGHQKLTVLCNSVSPKEALDVIKEDSDDNRVLECAAGAGSDYIVTEDKDLLRLGHYGKTRILNVADFMRIMVEQEQPKP